MQTSFPTFNSGYNQLFKLGKLTVGIIAPVDNYAVGEQPDLTQHVKRIQLAESMGFSGVWLRDVPFNVPAFGDVGQVFDPFVYLGFLAAQTKSIALGVASLILPLRHPAHIAKAIASADVLSQGRVVVGVASGDRPEEYPALNKPFSNRGETFRDSVEYLRQMWQKFPTFNNELGYFDGQVDMVPKPTTGNLPLLFTGGSRQHPEWIAQHSDGWITYPRPIAMQQQIIAQYRENLRKFERPIQPVMQSLYIDLVDDPNALPTPIHLGYRLGVNQLVNYLIALEEIGVNHVALNLRFSTGPIEQTMATLAETILPKFNH
ncbi:LLM class oxidoreductase [Thalassotalea agarivorans]|uniref:Luciferase-type oxidoreductase, BA3436 family n=1 Tax=Thalassotalea agarivorans TaxID=349064 RepID=A0A1H9Y7B0_THASX|nr:LLM class oxidoreductase [Thalassotalea agarivorans]SES64704.1 luciferase-type oxidoreductase, BA3436 family [Thalassotalea agarivorans]